jgi:transcriptional regulator with PAS, ATPase and Fis domain
MNRIEYDPLHSLVPPGILIAPRITVLQNWRFFPMADNSWVREFPAAITVCDANGIILSMNERSILTFADDGGASLIGANLLDCHTEPARSKVAALLSSKAPNVYSIEKGGVRKLIFQSPWYENGKFSGFVELSLPLPAVIPHFNRDLKTGDKS